MHIEYGGGKIGIRKYLEDGKKHGRELGGRDVMDERIVLAGDLEMTDKLITSMKCKGQRYLHITLSFVEKDLSTQRLGEIVDDYRALLMSAFRPDEYDFYAEAHVARLKNYTDVTTGEQIARLDHIHIVIPQINLLSGLSLNPVGLAKQNIRWLDAIQEHINEKCKLVSPKDCPREASNGVDIIHRSKLDNFKVGKIAEFKDALKAMIVAQNISTPIALETLICKFGEVKAVNAGKENAYFSVKPSSHGRYINLRDEEFRTEFLSLSRDEKLARSGIAFHPKVGVGKTTHKQRATLLAEWSEKRSLEIKYLNSGSKLYKKYQQQTVQEQLSTLLQIEEKFYLNSTPKEKFDEIKHRAGSKKGHNRFLCRQSNIEKDRSRTSPESVHTLRSMHKRSVDRDRKPDDTKKLLRNPVSNIVDGRGSSSHYELWRNETYLPRAGPTVNNATGRAYDSVANQLLRDHNEHIAEKKVTIIAEFQSLKQRLDASLLLAALSKSHGLAPLCYEITKGKDGGGRIRHRESTQNYNVSDFMTKHMRLAWKDAENYLRLTYQEQMSIVAPPRPATRPSSDLWKKFTQQRKLDLQDSKRVQELQRESELEQRREIKEDFYRKRALINSRVYLNYRQRRAEIALLQMTKVQEEARLREEIQGERAVKKDLRTVREHYRDWLLALAQNSNEQALLELRRQSHLPETKIWLTDSMICSEETYSETAYLHRQNDLQFEVQDNGDVTYSRHGKPLIQDQGRSIKLLDISSENIELGLRLALQKYGKNLNISGSDDFIEAAIRVAVDCKINVTFLDSRHTAYMQAYRDWLAKKEAIDISSPNNAILHRASNESHALQKTNQRANENIPIVPDSGKTIRNSPLTNKPR